MKHGRLFPWNTVQNWHTRKSTVLISLEIQYFIKIQQFTLQFSLPNYSAKLILRQKHCILPHFFTVQISQIQKSTVFHRIFLQYKSRKFRKALYFTVFFYSTNLANSEKHCSAPPLSGCTAFHAHACVCLAIFYKTVYNSLTVFLGTHFKNQDGVFPTPFMLPRTLQFLRRFS